MGIGEESGMNGSAIEKLMLLSRRPTSPIFSEFPLLVCDIRSTIMLERIALRDSRNQDKPAGRV